MPSVRTRMRSPDRPRRIGRDAVGPKLLADDAGLARQGFADARAHFPGQFLAVEHRQPAKHIACPAADAGDDDFVVMIVMIVVLRRRRTASRSRLRPGPRQAVGNSAIERASKEAERVIMVLSLKLRAPFRLECYNIANDISSLCRSGAAVRRSRRLARQARHARAGAMFMTHLECSLTGERYDSDRAPEPVQGRQAAAGPL